MRVLVACEFSGRVRDAFRARGHDAWSCDIVPTEVFNSSTSDVLDVGDAGSENRYLNDASLQALTRVALVPTGYVNTAPTLITVRWVSGGGTPTTGKVTLRVEYYVRGRSDLGPQGSDFGARLV